MDFNAKKCLENYNSVIFLGGEHTGLYKQYV